LRVFKSHAISNVQRFIFFVECSRSIDVLPAADSDRPRVDFILGIIDMRDKISYLTFKALVSSTIFTPDYFFGRMGIIVLNRTQQKKKKKSASTFSRASLSTQYSIFIC
jgi:hypothetical protein